MLDGVKQHLRGLQQETDDTAAAIRTRLNRLHSEMMDLRDALNDAINDTARAEELNDANEKNMEDHQVSLGMKDIHSCPPCCRCSTCPALLPVLFLFQCPLI